MRKNEKKQKYLQSYQAAKEEEKIIEEMLKELEENIHPKAIVYDNMPKGSAEKHDLSDYMIRYEKLMSKLEKKRVEKNKIQIEIVEKINDMKAGPRETERQLVQDKTVLYMRYIQGMRWEEIMEAIGYEWTQVHRIHGRALNNIIVE